LSLEIARIGNVLNSLLANLGIPFFSKDSLSVLENVVGKCLTTVA
jgi:hypothetical protein